LFHFGCWLLPEKFSFCPKNNGFALAWGPLPPGSYAYMNFMSPNMAAHYNIENKIKIQNIKIIQKS